MKRVKLALSFLLVIAILFSSMFVGCGDVSADISYSLDGITIDGTPSGLSGKPWENDPTASYKVTATDTILIDDFVSPDEGTLLVSSTMDDFEEGSKITISNVLKKYGWEEAKVRSGALSPIKASFSVSDYNNSGDNKLYIKGYDKTLSTSYGDGYMILLSSEVFGAYQESDYSFSYDVIYNGTDDPTSCFAICTDYNYDSFNYFAITNAGAFRFQKCEHGTFSDIVKVNTTLLESLIGVKYDKTKDALTGISMSVRGVVTEDGTSSYYVRVNSEGYSGTGKWVLVFSAKTEKYGSAIALRNTDGQNGYFDNFAVWAGTTAEPTSLTEQAIDTSKKVCTAHNYEGNSEDCEHSKTCKYCGHVAIQGNHTFIEVEGANDAICTTCGCYYSTLIQRSWAFYDIPKYREGGDMALDIAYIGSIPNSTQYLSTESQMQIISNATSDMAKKYAVRLSAYGFTQSFANSIEKNVYYQYMKDGKSVYFYYSLADETIRIIYDKYACISPSDISYTAESGKVSDTVYYQYGVEMAKTEDDGLKDNGMLHVIKLCDNSLVIIDGLASKQISGDAVDECMAFLRDITGTKDGEKIRIAAWLNTHSHSDHYAGIINVMAKYGEFFTIERIVTNTVSLSNNILKYINAPGDIKKMYNGWTNYVGTEDTMFLKVHNGAKFSLAGVEFEVIYTHEDLVDKDDFHIKSGDFNSSSNVYVITINGAKFFTCGDITEDSQGTILSNYTADTLKCDVLQTAHHCFNGVTEMYAINKAKFVLVTQGETYVKTIHEHMKRYLEAACAYAKEENVFFQDAGTFGLQVNSKGNVKLVYTREIPTYD